VKARSSDAAGRIGAILGDHREVVVDPRGSGVLEVGKFVEDGEV